MKILIITVLFAGFVFLSIMVSKYMDSHPCLKYKSVTNIEIIPQENFWGKKITYIYKFDDGSLYESDSSYTFKISDKECIER